MRKFKVFYSDNSGPKCEEFEGTITEFDDGWFKLFTDDPKLFSKLVIAIPTDAIYSVEEID